MYWEKKKNIKHKECKEMHIYDKDAILCSCSGI
jgi:hypothetical protein